MTRPSPFRLRIAATFLLLASIVAHALTPVSLPDRVRHGSAFNPTTVEVALGPQRYAQKALAQRSAPLPDPRPGTPPVLATASVSPVSALRIVVPATTFDVAPIALFDASEGVPPPAHAPPRA
ncbi:hypothetical protein [Sphingosinithalassobacter portus]|uniref:hypothetical protein n=1 Tax=Stakelama portus TaxID=2676234 RepID=UPI0011AB400B|nr:hypothetical protein [Sphingosinithalassobacter portus]